MTSYNSNDTVQPGQYPTTAWHLMGLPEQNESSGAPGGAPTDQSIDAGSTNEPGQYPAKETFTGVALGGTGAPGTQGVPNEAVSGEAGPSPDSVTYSDPTFYKSMYDDGGMEQGYRQQTARDAIGGPSDWTQANDLGYQAPAQYQMPGVAGNTPAPGEDGRYQTPGGDGSGHVLYGGYLKGARPGTTRHPTVSGPGT